MDKSRQSAKMFEGQRIGIISLGCARNTVDSEKILTDAKQQGAKICSLEKAKIVLLNTCAFTKDAKEESIGVLLDLIDLKKKGKIKKILVHGCLSERYPEELKENFKEVDGFYGTAGFKVSFDKSMRLTPRHWAYVKIAEGCANRCTYCAIPEIKGPLRSRTHESILKEIKFLEENGIKELNIIGQDITGFGLDDHHNALPSDKTLPLVQLLKKILQKTSIPWIRLLYLHPRRLSDGLIDLMAQEDRICPYVDLPLQHINNRILRLMDRKINRKEIISLLGKIRSRIPGVAIRTTFIVGFPSESEKEFDELLEFVGETRFDKLGVFAYSDEEGTKAHCFKGKIDEKTKQKRYNSLMSCQKGISKEILQKQIGERIPVLVEEDKVVQEGVYLGRTRKDAPEVDGVVFLKSKKALKPGSIVRCRITDAYEYDLTGEVAA
jgi:ribosomal protein S12 methylthiotransferase